MPHMHGSRVVLFVSALAVITGGGFWFFHATPSVCAPARDPSGDMSPLCTLGIPSPYQRIAMVWHARVLHETCAVNVETGGIECRPTLPASGCDQSATTTPCAELEALAMRRTPPPPWQPESVAPIMQATTTAVDPMIALDDRFSFSLPPGWHGEKYAKKNSGGGYNWRFVRGGDERVFSIDCPPDGKGLEAAVTLSREDRSLSDNGVTYAISLRKMTAPGNEPWLTVSVTTPQSWGGGPECVVWGTATPDTEEAIRMLYATWSGQDADAGGACGTKERFEEMEWWIDFKKKAEWVDFYRDNDVETILQQARDNTFLNPSGISYTYETFCAADQFKSTNICVDGRHRKVSFDDVNGAYFHGCLLDDGTFISVFPGEYPSNGNHVFKYDTRRKILVEVEREKEAWGQGWNIVPQVFGTRDGAVIKMRGSTGDAGASVTGDFTYDIAKNRITLVRSCTQEMDATPQCIRY